ncbi:MAG: hypothetical protein Q8904_10210 [Bacteroidota bacterium]|nr:hypothetical protein [Bacteroidota bacterium]
MKTKKMIFFLVLFSTLGVNAQTPVCKVDTTGWKRIPVIPIDFKSINPKCRDPYNTNSNLFIWFDNCFKQEGKNVSSYIILNEAIDLEKYNAIELYYGNFVACDISMDYALYKDRKGQPILVVNVFVPEIRCKSMIDLSKCFLVSKKNCPIKPKVCILQHQIDSPWYSK